MQVSRPIRTLFESLSRDVHNGDITHDEAKAAKKYLWANIRRDYNLDPDTKYGFDDLTGEIYVKAKYVADAGDMTIMRAIKAGGDADLIRSAKKVWWTNIKAKLGIDPGARCKVGMDSGRITIKS